MHRGLGSPQGKGCVELDSFDCWVCGARAARGCPRVDWMGANFVGQNRVRAPDSPYVCEPCVVVMAGRPPDTLRLTSHLWDDRGWLRPNKGDKAVMREWLRSPKSGAWFAALADSGKKHLLPWVPLNDERSRQGRVLFEERAVTVGDWRLVEDMTELLTARVTKAEIESSAYGPRSYALARGLVFAFERRWGGLRASGWFDVGLWLAQREEEQDATG